VKQDSDCNNDNLLLPIAPPGLNRVVGIAAGAGHNLALQDDGTAVAWLAYGFGVPSWRPNPVELAGVPGGLTGVAAIAAGGQYDGWFNRDYRFDLALKFDGTVLQWGKLAGEQSAYAGITNVVGIAAGQDDLALIVGDAFQGIGPKLLIQPGTAGTHLLSWPLAAQGFELESIDQLATSSPWTAVTNTTFIVDARKRVIEPSGPEAKFYRLRSR
jgi:hypothetical protein